MGEYQLVVYGITKLFLIVCTGLFIRRRFSWPVTIAILVPSAMFLLASEYLRYYLARQGIEQRLTNFLEFGGVLVVLFLSAERDYRTIFTQLLACIYGAFGMMVGKVLYTMGASIPQGALIVTLVNLTALVLLVRFLRPSYWKLQDLYCREWKLFSAVLGMFLLGLYLLYGAFKGLQIQTYHNLIPMWYLVGICVLMVMAFRMLDRLQTEAAQERVREILAVSEQSLRHEMEMIHRLERQVAEYNHDSRHFVRMVSGMLAEENYEGIEQALSQRKEYIPELGIKYYCGSPAVSGVLSYYVHTTEQKGISMKVSGEMAELRQEIEWEMASILGNLLENAVQNCLHAENEKGNARQIQVKLFQAGEQSMIEVRYRAAEEVRFEKKTGLPIMGQQYGLDMRGVADYIRKWGGQMDCGLEQGCLFVRILV